MDITEAIDALAQTINEARPRALGGGAIIDRERALQLVRQLQDALPDDIHRAQGVIGERDQLLAEGAATAEQILAQARAEAGAMVAEHAVTQAAHEEAHRILHQAEQDAAHKRAETDAYVDAKLASFEGTLQRTLEAVSHGRQRLAGQWQDQAGDEQHS